MFEKEYKIVGFATNTFVNENYSYTPLTNSIYYWLDRTEYKNIAQIYLNSEIFLLDCSFLETNNLNDSLTKHKFDPKQKIEKLKVIFNNFNFLDFNINNRFKTHPHSFSSNTAIFIKTKKRDLSIIISIFSILILIAAFIMISIIVNKIIHSNKKVIGNLKAQGYSNYKIAFALSNCFLFFTIVCCLFSILTAWLFGLVLNYTYSNYLEFIQWIPSFTDPIFLTCCLIVPCAVVYTYSFGFITILTSYRPLLLMSDNLKKSRTTKLTFLNQRFKKVSFKHKISLWFALNSKWKVLLTLVVTLLNTAILFSIYSFFKQTTTIQSNINNNYWNYLYFYQDNVKNQYDFESYDTKEAVKTKNNNEIDIKNLPTDLKNKWMSVGNFKKIMQNTKINNYQYIIDNLEKHNGVITFDYQPYINSDELLGNEIDRWEFEITDFNKTNQLYSKWKKQSNLQLEFLEWIFSQDCNSKKKSLCKSENFISNRINGEEIIDFNLNKFQDNHLELLNLNLDHIDATNFFKAKTINEIDFKNYNVQKTFDHTVLKWKALFEKVNLTVNVFPILISKALYSYDLADLFFKYDNEHKIVNLYYIVDYFTNLTKQLMFTNSLNNTYLKDKAVIKFSHLKETELNNFISIYDENNDYTLSNFIQNKTIKPIFKSQVNNNVFLKQSRYTVDLIKYILIIIIITFSVIGCILQLIVVLNIIIRENLKYINSFKILGYSKLWIFNRLFLMYLPIIIIAYLFAIPLGMLICYISQHFLLYNTVVYTALHINWINFLISAFSLFVIYLCAYLITMSHAQRKYPIYQMKQD